MSSAPKLLSCKAPKISPHGTSWMPAPLLLAGDDEDKGETEEEEEEADGDGGLAPVLLCVGMVVGI